MAPFRSTLALLALFSSVMGKRMKPEMLVFQAGESLSPVENFVRYPVKKLDHGFFSNNFVNIWRSRFLELRCADYSDNACTEPSENCQCKVQYYQKAQGPEPPSGWFDICKDHVGVASTADSAIFKISVGSAVKLGSHYEYVFKVGGSGPSSVDWVNAIIEKARLCPQDEIVYSNQVLKEKHSTGKRERKWLVLRTEAGSAGEQQYLLEYYSRGRQTPVSWDICEENFQVKTSTTTLIIIDNIDETHRNRKHTIYKFQPYGKSTTDAYGLELATWEEKIRSLQSSCPSTVLGEELVTLKREVQINCTSATANETSVELLDVGPKAKLHTIDFFTDKLARIQDILTESSTQHNLQLSKTLVVFDFDLTLRDDNPDTEVGGSILRQGEDTRQLLIWLKKMCVPVIVVTARDPSRTEWERTWSQADEELSIGDLLGQHVLESDAESKPCDAGAQCAEYSYTHNHTGGVARYVEGNGIILSGYLKGEAVQNFIKVHKMNIQQIVFADDYVTNAINVATTMMGIDEVARVHGIWFKPSDYRPSGSDFVDDIFKNTEQLMQCLQETKFSQCEKDVTWCDRRLDGYLGDNSYNPRTPENLVNVYAMDLGHFPATEDEQKMAREVGADAISQESSVKQAMRTCETKERAEIRADEEERLAKEQEAGGKPLCANLMQCRFAKKRGCDPVNCDQIMFGG